MQSGKSAEDAAIDGTKRVAVSVLAGVGTNVVVFLPLAFMGGIVGQFMLQFGMTVVYLTLLSLLFSFTLTPMMIAKLLKLSKNKQTKKEVKFVDGKFNLSDLDTNIYQIVKVCDEYNTAVKFEVIDGKIVANIVNASIKYTKFADEVELNGNVETFNKIMPARILAYETAMEYSFVNSLFDDASIWESRYKNSLLVLSQKKHNLIMPKRRWL